MNDDVLKSVAEQLMTGRQITIEGRSTPVTRTGTLRLRTARFRVEGKRVPGY